LAICSLTTGVLTRRAGGALLAADLFTGLAGLGNPLLGDLPGHPQMFLEDRELLLGELLQLGILLVLGLPLSHENVFLVAADLVKDERAVEFHSLLLLEFLELGLVDLVHLLAPLRVPITGLWISFRLLVLGSALPVPVTGLLISFRLLVLGAALLVPVTGLLGKLLELLLGALVVLNKALGELLDLRVLAALFDELPGLDFELVIAGGFADALLDVFGAHFFALILLRADALLGGGALCAGLVLLLGLTEAEGSGGSEGDGG